MADSAALVSAIARGTARVGTVVVGAAANAGVANKVVANKVPNVVINATGTNAREVLATTHISTLVPTSPESDKPASNRDDPLSLA